MFKQNLLKAKMAENGLSALQICREIGICEATFYRKMARNGDFSRFEIEKISETLKLSIAERNNIFFDRQLA